MREKMRNTSATPPAIAMFSLFGLVDLVARGHSLQEAAPLAGCSHATAEAIASSDAFKAALAVARGSN